VLAIAIGFVQIVLNVFFSSCEVFSRIHVYKLQELIGDDMCPLHDMISHVAMATSDASNRRRHQSSSSLGQHWSFGCSNFV